MRKRIVKPSTGYKIVAIDDEIGIIDSLSVVLQRNGYHFTGFIDPLEAIESIRTESYDLLILDYLMDPIHGDKVVEKIREFNNDLYILLLTGHKDLAPPLETIRALDIQGYCEKSDRFDQLLLLVESGIKSIAHERTIKEYKNGLSKIINAAPEIYRLGPVEDILIAVLPQITYIANSKDLFFLIDDPLSVSKEGKGIIFKGEGKYKDENTLSSVFANAAIMENISSVRESKQPSCMENSIIIPLINEYDESIGVILVDNASIDDTDLNFNLLKILANQISSSLNNFYLHSVVNAQNEELNKAYEQLRNIYVDTVETIRKAVDAKDIYTRGHSDRVSYYAIKIGEAFKLSESELEKLKIGGIFHDVGKIGISDDILLKTGKLSEMEYEAVKQHPLKGVNILSAVSLFNDIIPIVKYHHERIDGKGYPFGLRGKDIPFYARILSVADAFDAMMSDRHYRKRLSLDQAVAQLLEGAGTQFDAIVVNKFIELLSNYGQMVCEAEARYC
jgi:HD-GYP domain-containing protein (c-di-GMP phosphodiesterase class II)/FixJ family two-component response regulator